MVNQLNITGHGTEDKHCSFIVWRVQKSSLWNETFQMKVSPEKFHKDYNYRYWGGTFTKSHHMQKHQCQYYCSPNLLCGCQELCTFHFLIRSIFFFQIQNCCSYIVYWKTLIIYIFQSMSYLTLILIAKTF